IDLFPLWSRCNDFQVLRKHRFEPKRFSSFRQLQLGCTPAGHSISRSFDRRSFPDLRYEVKPFENRSFHGHYPITIFIDYLFVEVRFCPDEFVERAERPPIAASGPSFAKAI
ncbi:MAG TPA: hypothetical protein PKO33_01490, partial [Pyrinomonadaceae bacterium]|nr:hypothetical protein [Pyrinomonadaceae bacterium]